MSIYPYWIFQNYVNIWAFQHDMPVCSPKDIKRKFCWRLFCTFNVQNNCQVSRPLGSSGINARRSSTEFIQLQCPRQKGRSPQIYTVRQCVTWKFNLNIFVVLLKIMHFLGYKSLVFKSKEKDILLLILFM